MLIAWQIEGQIVTFLQYVIANFNEKCVNIWCNENRTEYERFLFCYV